MSFAIIAAVATIAGTATNVYGSIQAGKVAEDAAKEQARQEKIQAESEELARREELNRQLAAQNAAMAASGVATEGTPASIALESAKSISQSEGMISLSGKLARAQTIRSGQAAKAAGYTQGISTLLNSAEDLYNAGKTIKDKSNKPKEGGE
jgi:translation elongation factor EF-Tu-like GTPase